MSPVAHIHPVPMVCVLLGASDYEDGIPATAIDRVRADAERRAAWLHGWHMAHREDRSEVA